MTVDLQNLDSLDWYSLPWKKIEKFVLSFQKQIYNATFSQNLQKVHRFQSLLSQSYALRLLALRRAIEYFKTSKKYFNKLNSLNSKQKLDLAKSLDLATIIADLSFQEENRFESLQAEAKEIMVYFCLRPQWEAQFQLNNYSYSFNVDVKKIIAMTIFKLRNHKWQSGIYVFNGVIETYFSTINQDYLFKVLDSIPIFYKYLELNLQTLFKKEKIFKNIDISLNQIDSNNLLELLGHILMFNFEKDITSDLVKNTNSSILLKIIRYKNHFLIFSDSLKLIYSVKNNCIKFFTHVGLNYDWKKTKIFTNQQIFRFLGFDISSNILLTYNSTYQRLIILPTKEEKKLILAKIRYILRNKQKNGKTRARTNMPLGKAISLINPLVKNWRDYYINFVPKSILLKMDWLLNEKVYRWYIKRLKKNRVNHWNLNCIKLVNNKRRIADGTYVLELFGHI
uniref:putative reverse transcriptase/maturase n=1 Tax=Pulvinaster venetus TaxID=427767 RepID=UPI001FCDB00A|nr:putative reverse transcriptase/maturase [Pulvinaster venetus]UNJ17015.1 putative reverse transcriptase/maturase [Pulvinaster venetus]